MSLLGLTALNIDGVSGGIPGVGQPSAPLSTAVSRRALVSQARQLSPELRHQYENLLSGHGRALGRDLQDLRSFLERSGAAEQTPLSTRDLLLALQILEQSDPRTQRSAVFHDLAALLVQRLASQRFAEGEAAVSVALILRSRSLLLAHAKASQRVQLQAQFQQQDRLWRRSEHLQALESVMSAFLAQSYAVYASQHPGTLDSQQIEGKVQHFIEAYNRRVQDSSENLEIDLTVPLQALLHEEAFRNDFVLQAVFLGQIPAHQAFQRFLRSVSSCEGTALQVQTQSLVLARELGNCARGFVGDLLDLSCNGFRMLASICQLFPEDLQELELNSQEKIQNLANRLWDWSCGIEELSSLQVEAWQRRGNEAAWNESYLSFASHQARSLSQTRGLLREEAQRLGNELSWVAGEQELSTLLREHSLIGVRSFGEATTPLLGAVAAVLGGWIGLLGRTPLSAALIGGGSNGVVQVVGQLLRQLYLEHQEVSLKEALTQSVQSFVTGAGCGLVGHGMSSVLMLAKSQRGLGMMSETGLREFRWSLLRFGGEEVHFWSDVLTEVALDEGASSLGANRNIQNRLGLSVPSAGNDDKPDTHWFFKIFNNAMGERVGDVWGEWGHEFVHALNIHFDQHIQLERVHHDFQEVFDLLGPLQREAEESLSQFLLSYQGEGGSVQRLISQIRNLGEVREVLHEICSRMVATAVVAEAPVALPVLSIQLLIHALGNQVSLQCIEQRIDQQAGHFLTKAKLGEASRRIKESLRGYFASLYAPEEQHRVLREISHCAAKLERVLHPIPTLPPLSANEGSRNQTVLAGLQEQLLQRILFSESSPNLDLERSVKRVARLIQSRQALIQKTLPTELQTDALLRAHFLSNLLKEPRALKSKARGLWEGIQGTYAQLYPDIEVSTPGIYRSAAPTPKPTLAQFAVFVFEQANPLLSPLAFLQSLQGRRLSLSFKEGKLQFKEREEAGEMIEAKAQAGDRGNPEKGNQGQREENNQEAGQNVEAATNKPGYREQPAAKSNIQIPSPSRGEGDNLLNSPSLGADKTPAASKGIGPLKLNPDDHTPQVTPELLQTVKKTPASAQAELFVSLEDGSAMGREAVQGEVLQALRDEGGAANPASSPSAPPVHLRRVAEIIVSVHEKIKPLFQENQLALTLRDILRSVSVIQALNHVNSEADIFKDLTTLLQGRVGEEGVKSLVVEAILEIQKAILPQESQSAQALREEVKRIIREGRENPLDEFLKSYSETLKMDFKILREILFNSLSREEREEIAYLGMSVSDRIAWVQRYKIKAEKEWLKSLVQGEERDARGSVRRFAVQALGELGSAAELEWLKSLLVRGRKRDADGDVRSSAVAALGKLGGAAELEWLKSFLRGEERDTSESVRSSAVAALGKLGGAAELEWLKSFLRGEERDTSESV
ncbi:MAG: HEAT repeat domain-containing protein, partial [Deltaproteobacteria bacterium]|nr:HEAT repeat domain-containing protein [Deltaproteobacteria bacterium]